MNVRMHSYELRIVVEARNEARYFENRHSKIYLPN